MPAPLRVLFVTAVVAERDAVTAGLPEATAGPEAVLEPETVRLPGGYVLHRHPLYGAARADVLAAGVGPSAAAAGTATALTAAALAREPYGLVVSAGIGGGFPGVAAPGRTVVSDAVVAADLGAQTAGGFASVTALGFGTDRHLPPADLAEPAAAALDAVHGPVLTVSTATGTAARARELADAHPGAAAEAMEGFGVAEAASAHGVPVLEVRTVSNAVGPRDREAWRIPGALSALRGACEALVPVLRNWVA